MLRFFSSSIKLTLHQTKQLHALILVTGTDLLDYPYPILKLIRSYSTNHDLRSSHQLFDEIPHWEKNIYLWNSIIRSYSIIHDFQSAIFLFSQLQISHDANPDEHTFASLLRAFAEINDSSRVKMIHGGIIVSGFHVDYITSSSLVSSYSKLGLIPESTQVFDRVPNPDLVLQNSMISACGHAGFWEKSLEIFHGIQISHQKPDGYSLVGLISSFREPELLLISQSIHGYCLKAGFDSIPHVRSSLVSMYSRCSCLHSAFQIFESLSHPDLITWSALISGYSSSGFSKHALSIFSQMHSFGTKPDAVLISTLLSASASSANLDPTKEIHSYLMKLGFESDIPVACTLMDAYLKHGFLESGYKIFKSHPQKTITSYNIIISGFAFHGLSYLSIELFDALLLQGLLPDKATFSALLSACIHSGLVNEASEFFRRMQVEFKIEPEMDHYVHMVRVLGMVGELKKAYKLIVNMPIAPDCGVWGALLWGCNLNEELELGKVVVRRIKELEPRNMAGYSVVLSNMFAVKEKWECVESLRGCIVDQGHRKVPGFSWIQVPD